MVFGIALPRGLFEVDSRFVYSHYNSLACPQADHIALQTAKLIEDAFQARAVPLPCDCRLCIESCPKGAIKAGFVEQKPCRQYSYGKTKRGFETVECNRCRTVCPKRFGMKRGKETV